jgi:hypothetical protein
VRDRYSLNSAGSPYAADLRPPKNWPSQFDFVVNLRTAHALGLAPPPDFVSAANEVIE